jgi:hypothetical protein
MKTVGQTPERFIRETQSKEVASPSLIDQEKSIAPLGCLPNRLSRGV